MFVIDKFYYFFYTLAASSAQSCIPNVTQSGVTTVSKFPSLFTVICCIILCSMSIGCEQETSHLTQPDPLPFQTTIDSAPVFVVPISGHSLIEQTNDTVQAQVDPLSKTVPFQTTIDSVSGIIIHSPDPSVLPRQQEYNFDPTNVSEMALETILGSENEACFTKDFVAVPEVQHRGPLACGEDGLVYRVRITNCGSGKLILTALNFLFEIHKITNGEDAEHRLFDGDATRTYRLRNIRVCDMDNAEWCRNADVQRINEKSAKISVTLNDEEAVELESKKDWSFDVKVTRNCTRTTTSLLRLDTQLIEVEGMNDKVRKDENIFGGIFNPLQKTVFSGWYDQRASTSTDIVR